MVGTVVQKNLVKVLLCLGKLSLQIRKGIYRTKKNKLIYYKISGLFSRLSAKLVTFLQLKTEFHCSYVQALFINFSVMAAMLLDAKMSFKVRMCE